MALMGHHNLPQRKLNLNIFERRLSLSEKVHKLSDVFQKFEAVYVLVMSDDENENRTYQLKQGMIHLPEHPKQVFKTGVRQE